MVKQASESERAKWDALPSKTNMGLRRIYSVILMGAFLALVTPFAPFSWVFGYDYSEHLLDRLLTIPILVGAIYFHWQISGIIAPLAIHVMDNDFVYSNKMFWKFAGTETAVLIAIRLTQNEIWRRLASVGLVGVLWAIGWAATPLRYKKEAWEQLKWLWVYMAFQEARPLVRGGRRRW